MILTMTNQEIIDVLKDTLDKTQKLRDHIMNDSELFKETGNQMITQLDDFAEEIIFEKQKLEKESQ